MRISDWSSHVCSSDLRDLRRAAAHDPDGPCHVAGHERGLALAGRPVRRPPVGALDPFHRGLRAGGLFPGAYADGAARRTLERNPLDDQRALSRAGGAALSLILSRRSLVLGAAATLAG